MNSDFLDCVRNGDCISALSLVERREVSSSVPTPASSVFAWLIEINAPTQLVIELLRHCVRSEGIDVNRLGLLEVCLKESPTTENAPNTFSSLLAFGLSPNVIVEGGATLLQKAIELNRTVEVTALLNNGVDPYQMSVFGRESTNNIAEAVNAGNAAGDLVVAKYQVTNTGSREK